MRAPTSSLTLYITLQGAVRAFSTKVLETLTCSDIVFIALGIMRSWSSERLAQHFKLGGTERHEIGLLSDAGHHPVIPLS